MAASKPRFWIERLGTKFIVLESGSLKFDEFDTRREAEGACSARNGAKPKTELHVLQEKFREFGVTPDRIGEYDQLLSSRHGDPEIYGKLQDRADQARIKRIHRLVTAYPQWLPQLLRSWADEIARQCGEKRDSWPTYRIFNAIRSDGECFAFKSSSAIAGVHSEIWPSWKEDYLYPRENTDGRAILVLHYLSPDPAHIKANYWGVSKRTYLEHVAAAHRWLALRLVAWSPSEDVAFFESNHDDGHWLIEDEKELGKMGIFETK
jgi:hypothetical protein